MLATVVSLDMGYGHMRAASPLAKVLGRAALKADEPPLADAAEQRSWRDARAFYERLTKFSQYPAVGLPLGAVLNGLTAIPPLHPLRDLSAPTLGARFLERSIRRGLGRGLVEHLGKTGDALLTTFYAPAIAAEHHGLRDIYCVVTDSDINRVWAPVEASSTRIRYLVPSPRAGRRLRAYGVPASQIELTGFPLPDSLLGGAQLLALRENLASRLVRLDPAGAFRSSLSDELRRLLPVPRNLDSPRAPLITFAVGGAGAQVQVGRDLVHSFKEQVKEGRVRLALVAGIRREVEAQLREAVAEAGLDAQVGEGVRFLIDDDLETYFERFNALLAETDVLWTKPSELTFYGALGLPMVLSSPVGVHEAYNRQWARELGAGLKQRDMRHASGWFQEWLEDGTLAGAAWAGFARMPKLGTYRIAELVQSGEALRPGA